MSQMNRKLTLWLLCFALAPLWLLAPALHASFNASPQAWTASYELDPTATDPVSQGDDHLRQAKFEIRSRVETEMDFGEIGNVTTDTGRLLEGGARAFVQSAAPTVDGTITASCLAEADYDGNRGCDEGRIWCDSDDDKCYFAEDSGADGDADSWTAMSATLAPLTASRAVVTDGAGALAAATTTATEIGYVNGVTSAIQTQMNLKAPLASPTFSGTITTPLTASRVVVTGASSELAASAVTTTELNLLSGATSLGGGLVKLATYTPSSASSVDITSVMSSTYTRYLITGRLTVATDDVQVWLRTDDANGASFDAGASDYGWDQINYLIALSPDADNADSEIVIAGSESATFAVGNAAGEFASFDFVFDTSTKELHGTNSWRNATSGAIGAATIAGYRAAGSTPNALRIIAESGNISGKVIIYGMAE